MHSSSRMITLTGHRLRIFKNRALRRVQSCVLSQYVTGADKNKKLCVVSLCKQELRRIRSSVLCHPTWQKDCLVTMSCLLIIVK